VSRSWRHLSNQHNRSHKYLLINKIPNVYTGGVLHAGIARAGKHTFLPALLVLLFDNDEGPTILVKNERHG
jgi:hypothetical protein